MAGAKAAPAAAPKVPVLPSVMIERFSRRRLRHGKGRFAGQPFAGEAWQLEAEAGIFDALDAGGTRIVREALVGIGKKNGKTHWAARLGCYGAFADGRWVKASGGWVWQPEYGAEVYNVAGSKDQAKVLFEIARGFVLRDPILRQAARVFKDAIEVPETESVWRVLASDAKLAHGPNPSMAIIDEWWAHRDGSLYEAFASAGAAREQPLTVVITTAGYRRDHPLFLAYQAGMAAERSKAKVRRAPSYYFRWWGASPNTKRADTKGWRAANPSRWVTLGYLRGELERTRRLGMEHEFDRFHRNVWTDVKDPAIPVELWDGGEGRPAIKPGDGVIVAVDSAPKRDHTGIAIVRRDGRRTVHARLLQMAPDPETGYLRFDLLEDLLRETAREFEVRRILVDPAYMIRSMLLLADEGLPVEEYPQGDALMVPASMHLYELLIEGRLRHGGLAWMRDQVQNAHKRVTERGWRLTKKGSGVIDGLTALAIAAYEADREQAEPELQLFV